MPKDIVLLLGISIELDFTTILGRMCYWFDFTFSLRPAAPTTGGNMMMRLLSIVFIQEEMKGEAKGSF